MRVFYDPVPDQVWIEGQPRSFARRSLIASLEGDSRIGIRMLHAAADDLLISTAFSNILDGLGNAFSSRVDVKAYLDAEFSKARRFNALVLAMVASVDIGGHRAVRGEPSGEAVYASADDGPTVHGSIAGISAGSAVAGGVFDLVVAGEMVEPSWSWEIGPVWLGLNGALTQAAPTAGVDQQVGVAIAPTRLIVDIAPAIILAQ